MSLVSRLLSAPVKSTLSFGTGGATVWDEGDWWSRPMVSWTPLGSKDEDPNVNFAGHIEGAYKSNGIVFACILARAQAFSEVRFQFQRLTNGRPGDLFGTSGLALLEAPWPNGRTGDLLWRMEQDASLGGNFFAVVVDGRIRRLRPDWVTLLTGSPTDDANDPEARVTAVAYNTPAGDSWVYPIEQICHWAPIPDPSRHWRGMSWLTPIVREVSADSAAVRHKQKFYEHGTTSNFVVSYDANLTPEQFRRTVELYRQEYAGVDNAYKTIHLGGGADITTIGADLKQLDFKATQGQGETRIAAAAGAHPVVVGLAEGLSGSSLNAGNFDAALRRFADLTIRPNWRSAAAALETLIPPPVGSRLWVDTRDVPFLRGDEKKEAEIQASRASTLETYIRAGFTAASAVAALDAGETVLQHTGLFSVQLQEAGMTEPTPEEGQS